MKIGPLCALSVAALILSTLPSYSGPCSQQIEQTQVRIDAELDSIARAGATGKQSVAATLSHQPTPRSIARAEVAIGEFSPEAQQALAEAMDRAREADASGDGTACDRALDDARRAIGD
jgi:glutamate synthase domain-containing protein 2